MEGTKQYLFRPEKNMHRLQSSCARIALPVIQYNIYQ